MNAGFQNEALQSFDGRTCSRGPLAIAQYIDRELREPATAKRLVGEIKEMVMGLAEMPVRCALVADERLAAQSIRKLLVENYIVFYVTSEKDKTVIVLRILYGRREWEHLL